MAFLLSWLGITQSPLPKPASSAQLEAETHLSSPCSKTGSSDSISIIDQEEIIMKLNLDGVAALAASIIRQILDIHDELRKLDNYKPGHPINDLLGSLVQLCSKTYDRETVRQVLNNYEIKHILPDLRAMCDEAEAALEAHWADKIIAESEKEHGQTHSHQSQHCSHTHHHHDDAAHDAGSAFQCLQTFPYYANYVDLTRFELHSIMTATAPIPSKIAFLGSGPMPLTSLCILAALKDMHSLTLRLATDPRYITHPAEVHNIDRNASAIEQSKKLCKALGPHGEGMHFICDSAGSDSYDLSSFDIVYMAALVGRTQVEKEDIMLSIANKMKSGALMVIRSAHGLKTCLYSEIDITSERLADVLEPCMEAHPYGQVVNSVVIARKK